MKNLIIKTSKYCHYLKYIKLQTLVLFIFTRTNLDKYITLIYINSLQIIIERWVSFEC